MCDRVAFSPPSTWAGSSLPRFLQVASQPHADCCQDWGSCVTSIVFPRSSDWVGRPRQPETSARHHHQCTFARHCWAHRQPTGICSPMGVGNMLCLLWAVTAKVRASTTHGLGAGDDPVVASCQRADVSSHETRRAQDNLQTCCDVQRETIRPEYHSSCRDTNCYHVGPYTCRCWLPMKQLPLLSHGQLHQAAGWGPFLHVGSAWQGYSWTLGAVFGMWMP
jgi:hypothetical protein